MNIAKWVVSCDNYRGQNPLIAVTEAAKLMTELTENETFLQHLLLSSLMGIFAVTLIVWRILFSRFVVLILLHLGLLRLIYIWLRSSRSPVVLCLVSLPLLPYGLPCTGRIAFFFFSHLDYTLEVGRAHERCTFQLQTFAIHVPALLLAVSGSNSPGVVALVKSSPSVLAQPSCWLLCHTLSWFPHCVSRRCCRTNALIHNENYNHKAKWKW